jgi:hypothetical protein
MICLFCTLQTGKKQRFIFALLGILDNKQLGGEKPCRLQIVYDCSGYWCGSCCRKYFTLGKQELFVFIFGLLQQLGNQNNCDFQG